jgi:hypothetical protein
MVIKGTDTLYNTPKIHQSQKMSLSVYDRSSMQKAIEEHGIEKVIEYLEQVEKDILHFKAKEQENKRVPCPVEDMSFSECMDKMSGRLSATTMAKRQRNGL